MATCKPYPEYKKSGIAWLGPPLTRAPVRAAKRGMFMHGEDKVNIEKKAFNVEFVVAE